MGVFHPLRRTRFRVTITVLCLLVVTGIVPKHLSGWILKPLFGWNWFAFLNGYSSPIKASRELLAGVLCITGYVRKAIERVEDERTAVEAERDAFSTFADSVRRLDAPSQTSFDAPTAALISTSQNQQQLQKVRDLYRETVMAVPGYEEEYGESLRENLTAEFGEEVATAVLDGEQLTPHLKDMLVNQATAAARERETLLEAIDDERDALFDALRRFETVGIPLEGRDELELSERSFEALVDYDRRSRRDEARYERILRDRQQQLQRKARWVRNADAAFLQTYLYRDLDVRFPVLHEGLERIKRLRERRRVAARLISRRD